MNTSEILEQNIDNIKRKVEDGKTLSAVEINLLKEVESEEPQIDQGFSATKISEILGYNRETVRKRLSLLNKSEHGARYTWREVVDAYAEFEKRSTTGIDGRKSFEGDHERARKDAAIADKYELELNVRKGELVEAKDVLETWKGHVLRCKARLLGMSTKLAPLLVAEEEPKAIKKLIDEEINDALEELCKDEDSKRAAGGDG